jgi:hypothetical protein
MSSTNLNWKKLVQNRRDCRLDFCGLLPGDDDSLGCHRRAARKRGASFRLVGGKSFHGSLAFGCTNPVCCATLLPHLFEHLHALKKTGLSYTTLAVLLAFAGITLFLATLSAFSWQPLSERYAAATTPSQQEQFLAVGEALLVMYVAQQRSDDQRVVDAILYLDSFYHHVER